MKIPICAIVLPLGVVDASAPAAGSALVALKSLDYRYFVAGGTCAAISHGITTPIDVVRESSGGRLYRV